MIYIKDDLLDDYLIDYLSKDESGYERVDTPGKSFWVRYPTNDFIRMMCKKVSEIEGNEITNVLSFFREAKEGQDDDWRIHNDSIINGEQPDRALVLFISDIEEIGLNGTAFWEHKELGDTFDGDEDKFNKMIVHDADFPSYWTLRTVVGHKKNRMVSYPCNYFHSKYPNKFTNSRKVFVMFYKINKYENND
jgi:hypothetical protein